MQKKLIDKNNTNKITVNLISIRYSKVACAKKGFIAVYFHKIQEGLKSYLTVNNVIQFYNKNCTTVNADKQVEVNFMARKI